VAIRDLTESEKWPVSFVKKRKRQKNANSSAGIAASDMPVSVEETVVYIGFGEKMFSLREGIYFNK